jgi:hypothetical protein
MDWNRNCGANQTISNIRRGSRESRRRFRKVIHSSRWVMDRAKSRKNGGTATTPKYINFNQKSFCSNGVTSQVIA